MRPMTLIVASLCVVAAAESPLLGQTTDTLKKLNAVLASSCYNSPVLHVSADGTVVRKDADGGTMTFKLADIGSVTIDNELGAHVLLTCKADAECIERVAAHGATKTSMELLAFSITPFEMGDSVLRLFQELTAPVVTTAVKTDRQFFAGSTFFLLGNLARTNPPDLVQLNLGYRITPKNVISIEVTTWKYAWPLGIPWGKSREAPGEQYPGYVRDYGVALVYQRFWWKGAYTAVHAMSAIEEYVDSDNKKIQNGYQLFMTYRLGYHFQLFKNRFFIEPSLAATHWPIRTHVPEAFARTDDKWPHYFLLEPGLHFGVNF